MRRLLPVELRVVERQLRLLAILDVSEKLGFVPLQLVSLHVFAYLADALAPVWNLPIMDGQILKQTRPYYPVLQADLDVLVGLGVVGVEGVGYLEAASGSWRLEASYRLRREFADPILSAAAGFPEQHAELSFVNEVVCAASGLDLRGIQLMSTIDATYSDPIVGLGGMIELDEAGEENATARTARRFGTLLAAKRSLTSAEMIHLYVRQLYSRMDVA